MEEGSTREPVYFARNDPRKKRTKIGSRKVEGKKRMACGYSKIVKGLIRERGPERRGEIFLVEEKKRGEIETTPISGLVWNTRIQNIGIGKTHELRCHIS